MNDFIHLLIERYGLIAVFLGCVAEGESAAILSGFLSHQAVFVPWQAFAAASLGAFAGDTFAFMLGRRFSHHPIVERMRDRPGFAQAYRLVQAHPNLFVLTNRFIYGLRMIGGVAAGFSTIPMRRFVLLNALSSLVWAALFCTIGYVFGFGIERVVGNEIVTHRRLLIALALLVGVALTGWLVARHAAASRQKRADASQQSDVS